MNLDYLSKFVKSKIEKHPSLKNDIMDLYKLCKDEISEGSSESHEVGLCIFDIEELIKNISISILCYIEACSISKENQSDYQINNKINCMMLNHIV